MKHRAIALTVTVTIALLGLILTTATPTAADRDNDRWTSLGDLHVRDRVDRDTLNVGIRKGTFDAIRLEVTGRAVQFHRLEVHFENGAVQEISLRSVIRAGGSSRVIDLEGGRRAIDKIVFVYDAQTRRRGKGARVEVYGRHQALHPAPLPPRVNVEG